MKINGVNKCCNCQTELSHDYDFCSVDCEQDYLDEKKYASRYEGHDLTPAMYYKKRYKEVQ